MIHQVHGYKLAYEEQTGKKINKMFIVSELPLKQMSRLKLDKYYTKRSKVN